MPALRQFSLALLPALLAVPAIAGQLAIKGLTSVPDPELTTMIATLGEDIEVSVQENQSVFEALVHRCGNNLRYLDIARERIGQNKDIYAPSTSEHFIDVPACLPPGTLIQTPVVDGDTLSGLATRYEFDLQARLDPQAYLPARLRDTVIGLNGDFSGGGDATSASQSLAQAMLAELPSFADVQMSDGGGVDMHWLRSQDFFAGTANNWSIRALNGLSPDLQVKADAGLLLPAASEWSTVKLKEDLSPHDTAVLAARVALLNASPSGAPTAESTRAVLADKDPQFLEAIGDAECGAGSAPALDIQAITTQMAMNNAFLDRPEMPPGRGWLTILVLDTGFPDDPEPAELANILPKASRYAMPAYGGTLDTGTVGPIRTDFSINTATMSNQAEPSPLYDGNLWHGLAVSMTALGGSAFADMRGANQLPIQVAVASLLDNSERPKLDITGIIEALNHVRQERIDVVNASFMFPNDPPSADTLKALLDVSTILVVAASNSPTALHTGSTFPAKLGGAPANGGDKTIITVGMLDTEGEMHPQSARSKIFVDLFAPGCHIASYDLDTDQGRAIRESGWNGTSFAAPIVSLTAALLRWYDLRPKQVKERLIYTVDFDPAMVPATATTAAHLRYEAYSRGKLNMRNALAVPFDIVIGSDGKTRYGTMTDRTIQICGTEFKQHQLARISIRKGRIYYWELPDNPVKQQFAGIADCPLGDDSSLSATFSEYGTDQTEPASLDGTADIIFAAVQ